MAWFGKRAGGNGGDRATPRLQIGQRVKVKGRLEEGRRFHATKIKLNPDSYRWDELESAVEWVNEPAQSFGLLGFEVHVAAPAGSASRPAWPSVKRGAFVKVSGQPDGSRFVAERVLVQQNVDESADEIQGEIRAVEESTGTVTIAGLTVTLDHETRFKGFDGARRREEHDG